MPDQTIKFPITNIAKKFDRQMRSLFADGIAICRALGKTLDELFWTDDDSL